jgi:dephospho-CoA kinase
MTKIIGLTGGIGSGKTTIAKYIQSLNIPVYIADEHAKNSIDIPEISNKIQTLFGKNILENDKINRKKLAKIVFNSPEKLNKLNQIIHPAVNVDYKNWLKTKKKFPFVFKETAILFESGSYKDCDKIITVVAPLETRINRVIDRDNCSREEVLNRISNQWSDEMKAEKSDFIIENIDIENTHTQINEILKKL